MTFYSHHPTLEVGQAHKAQLQRITHSGKLSRELKKGGSTLAQELYRIRVEGHLDQHWSSWFEGLTITHLEDGETQLSGYLADVEVGADVTVPGQPNIFVIEDTARAMQNGKPLEGLAPVAI